MKKLLIRQYFNIKTSNKFITIHMKILENLWKGFQAFVHITVQPYDFMGNHSSLSEYFTPALKFWWANIRIFPKFFNALACSRPFSFVCKQPGFWSDCLTIQSHKRHSFTGDLAICQRSPFLRDVDHLYSKTCRNLLLKSLLLMQLNSFILIVLRWLNLMSTCHRKVWKCYLICSLWISKCL